MSNISLPTINQHKNLILVHIDRTLLLVGYLRKFQHSALFNAKLRILHLVFNLKKKRITKYWPLIFTAVKKGMNIDQCTKKETILRVGHFTTISGHFSANYINIFHKTGVQTNILRCLPCLNLNQIRSNDIKHFWGFSIL